MYFLVREVDVSQDLGGTVTLANEFIEQRGELGRFVNTFTHADDQQLPCDVGAETCCGGLAGPFGFAQLNLPLDPLAQTHTSGSKLPSL